MKTTAKKKNNTARNVLIGAAVVGAGVTAAVLSKKENREKLGKAIKNAGKKGKEILSDIGDKKDEIVKNIEEEFESIKSNIEKSTAKGAKELKKEVDSISMIVKEIRESNKENVGDLISQVKVSIKNLKKDFQRITKG